jgi:pimeloyl-ACP methyl ester carboxylesterase
VFRARNAAVSHTAEATNDGRLSGFRNDEARTRFLAVYDDAIASWPVTPEQSDVDTRFGPTHVLTCGPPAGVPVVLLHGIAVSAASWAPNIGMLSERHRVVAADAMADAGRSVQRAPLANGADLARWLGDVVDALGAERVHVVGLSYGGWIALNVALHAPERLQSVTMVDPPNAFAAAPATALLKLAPDAVLAKFAKSDAALHRILRRMNGGSLPGQPMLDLSVAGLRCFTGKAPRPVRCNDDELRSITTPALVLFGERTPVTNVERAQERARLMPNATVEVVPGAGHAIPAERPEWFDTRVLAFLEGIEPASEQP